MTKPLDNKQQIDLAHVIKENPAFFRILINALPFQIFVKDRNGTFLAANTSTARIMGIESADNLLGKSDADFYPKNDATEYKNDEQDLLATGKPIIEKPEPKHDKATGEKRLIWVTKLPIRDSDSNIVGLVGFGNDLTDRKRAEEKLFEERNMLRTLLDTIPDYIYVKDSSSRFILSNLDHARHLGADNPDELIGKTDFDFYPKELAERFFADEQEIIRTGKPLIHKEENNTSLKGHFCRVLSSKFPLRDAAGKITGIVGTSLEITQKKRIEQELRQVNDRLLATLDELKKTQDKIIQNERLRALGQMASGIAHDFNNALTPILGYSDLLLNGPGLLEDRSTALNMLGDIRTAALNASQTVRRLSEFYAPAKKTERKLVNVKTLIESTLALTRPLWKEEMTAKGININVVTNLGETQNVFGNESQLREMLTNLIFNAVDAMLKGGTLTISARSESPSTIIEVADTGAGMTEEVRCRCFEPFFTTKRKRGGGLGLSMVHGIIRQHDGTIDVTSREGIGTTFVIKLPETGAPAPQEHTTATPIHELRTMRVLLIDDEEIVRQTIEACLKGDNHTVRTAVDGTSGMELFRTEKFDIVITDRAMPGMTGDRIATEIKKINPDIPVIMLTGFGHVMKDLHQSPADVDLIVSKPVTREALRDSLIRAFSHKKR